MAGLAVCAFIWSGSGARAHAAQLRSALRIGAQAVSDLGPAARGSEAIRLRHTAKPQTSLWGEQGAVLYGLWTAGSVSAPSAVGAGMAKPCPDGSGWLITWPPSSNGIYMKFVITFGEFMYFTSPR